LTTQQYGYRHVIRELFRIFLAAAEKKNDWVMFPQRVQEQLSRVEDSARSLARVVSDFISSMTEQQALEMYQRIAGISFGSVLKSIV
jgi:dGTPase